MSRAEVERDKELGSGGIEPAVGHPQRNRRVITSARYPLHRSDPNVRNNYIYKKIIYTYIYKGEIG